MHWGGSSVLPHHVPEDSVLQTNDFGATVLSAGDLELLSGSALRPLLDRAAPNKQSWGRFALVRDVPLKFLRLVRIRDTFHAVVHQSTWKSILLFCVAYTVVNLAFSGLYLCIAEDCSLGIRSWLDAVYFSLEIGTTLGFGVPSNYMKPGEADHGCSSAALLIFSQAMLVKVMDALLVGLLYSRISRGTSRAMSLCFSEKAVIREIHGRLFLMIQVCEARRSQLLEARVRLYCFLARRGPFGPVLEQRAMRLLHPNDELGANLLLATPCCLVHEIDAWSPLCPDKSGADFPGLIRRAAEADATAEDCAAAGPPSQSTASAEGAVKLRPSRMDVECLVRDTWLEVAVVLEGTEPTTSAVLQARHGYGAHELLFDRAFAPCVRVGEDGRWHVDLDLLHHTVAAPPVEDRLVTAQSRQ